MALESLHQFMVEVNTDLSVCVDERPHSSYWGVFERNKAVPTKLPGGPAIFVDYLKKYKFLDEVEAWQVLINSGIRLVAHKGPDHASHQKESPYGCGWNMLVEKTPERLGLPHSANAAERIKIVEKNRGLVYVVYGDHQIDEAFINYDRRHTLDVDSARKNDIGVLWCDVGAIDDPITNINRRNNKGISLNVGDFREFVRDSFEKVVEALTASANRVELYRAPVFGHK